jgi:hypothetical protein
LSIETPVETASMTFNGRKPEDYGAILASITEAMPAPRTITDSVPYRDGVYDFSRFDGSLHYDNRTISCVFNIVGDTASEAADILSKIAAWLYTDGDNTLVDNHDPDWVYEEVACTGIEISYLLSDKSALQATATLSAAPYKVSASGIVNVAFSVTPSSDAEGYYFVYKSSDNLLGVCQYSNTKVSKKLLSDISTSITIDGTYVEVLVPSYTQAVLLNLTDYMVANSNNTLVKSVYIACDGKKYSPDLYDNGLFSIYMPASISSTMTLCYNLSKELAENEIGNMRMDIYTITQQYNIGSTTAPLTVESYTLPTITIYSGAGSSGSSSKVYPPGTDTIYISDGIYRVVIEGSKDKQITFTYDGSNRRL